MIGAEVVGVDGAIQECTADDLGLAYRHSNLKDGQVVAAAAFRFRPGSAAEGEEIMRDVIRWRKEHQPGGTLNAGSVFKNPEGEAAGAIIDRVGLKGFAVGGASVSTRHANFFVAAPGASAADVHELVRQVRRRVLDATGVELIPEIRFVGFEENDW
jgi:UDP-N-acetylmuramate dehydrogenase